MPAYAHPESLVSTQWVAEHLNDPNVRIVEVVWGSSGPSGKEAYEAGHIPGAMAWDYKDDYFNPETGDIADKRSYEKLLSRSGIQPETAVVLYGGVENMNATFEYWLLKVYGHQDVCLLDGGRRKWMDENRPLTLDVPVYQPTAYKAKEPNWSLRASREEILQAFGKDSVILIDARTKEMYHGNEKPGTERGGHIPGAILLAAWPEMNPDGSLKSFRLPTTRSDGTMKTANELQAIFDNLGIGREKEIITYCVLGGASTHAWFVLTQLLGYPYVREYDRSWAEWGNLEGMPIEL